MSIPSPVNAPNPDIDGNPTVTALADGRAAIAYQSRGEDGEFDIVLRIREADGTLGPEHRPEGSWTGARKADLTTLDDGTLLLSWLGRIEERETHTDSVFAQRFGADGTDPSPVVRLADDVPRDHRIEADPDGGFVLYSEEPVQFYGDTGGTAERYDTNGSFVPAEEVGYRTIELTGDRRAFANNKVYEGSNVVGIFGIDGTFLPPTNGQDWVEFPSVDPYFFDYADIPLRQLDEDRIAVLMNDQYLFYRGPDNLDRPRYNETPEATAYSPLHAYILSQTGGDEDPSVSLSDPIFIPENRRPISPVESSNMIALQGGGFAVTWTRDADVYAQVIDASGVYVGDNFEVASGEAPQRIDSLAQLDNGNLLFVWQEKQGDNVEVMSREVTLAELAEGDYTVEERPILGLRGFIEGEAEEGATLRIINETLKNYAFESVSIQWSRNGQAIEGATDMTYRILSEDVGARISVGVTASLVTGLTKSGQLSVGVVENVQVPAEGTILVDGAPVSGQLLTAQPAITDLDGIPDNSFFYRWLRDGEEIDGAFRPAYRLTEADIGARIEAEIRFVDGEGAQERVVSDDLFIRAAPTDGDDILIGGPRAERFSGLGGDDRIDGGQGNDRLQGGEGADIFVFAEGHGIDVIRDFTPGTDRVEFDFDGIGGVRALLRAVDFSQVGDDVRIDFGDDDVLILRDVDKGDLTAADALFV